MSRFLFLRFTERMGKRYPAPLDDHSLRCYQSCCNGYKFPGDAHWWYLASATLWMTLGGLSMLAMGPDLADSNCTTPESILADGNGCFTREMVIGVGVFVASYPLGILSAGMGILLLSRKRWFGWSLRAVTLLLLTLWSIFTSIVVFTIVYIIRPQNTFDLNTNPLMVLIGGFIVVGIAPLSAVCLAIILRFHGLCGLAVCNHTGTSATGTQPCCSSSAHKTDIDPSTRCCARGSGGGGWCTNFTLISIGFIFLGAWYVANTLLSPIWNYSSHSYLQFVSPDAFYNYPIPNSASTNLEDPFYHGPIIMKFYLDHVVYFGYIAVLMIVGTVITFGPVGLRVWCHHRIKLCSAPSSAKNNKDDSSSSCRPESLRCTLGVARGELFFYISLTGLLAFWCWYWRYSFTHMYWEVATENQATYVELECWARVMGLITVFFASFLLWPLGKNSMLIESVFGVPHDRGVRLHRMCGVMVFVTLWCHALLWYANWYQIGVLWDNLFTINNLQISTTATHYDNWVVASLSQACLMGLTIMIGIAYL